MLLVRLAGQRVLRKPEWRDRVSAFHAQTNLAGATASAPEAAPPAALPPRPRRQLRPRGRPTCPVKRSPTPCLLPPSCIRMPPFCQSMELGLLTPSAPAMLHALRHVPGANAMLPFVRQFYTSRSRLIWHDAQGAPHITFQAEGGEQGERLLAFMDDIYADASPDRVRPVFDTLSAQLQTHCRIRLLAGKARVWNASWP